MDLAKQKSHNFLFEKSTKYLFYIPGLWLTYHVLMVLISGTAKSAMDDFIKYRDAFYIMFFSLLLIFIVLSGVFKNRKLSQYLPNIILGIILVTFSYSLAGILFGLYNLIIRVI